MHTDYRDAEDVSSRRTAGSGLSIFSRTIAGCLLISFCAYGLGGDHPANEQVVLDRAPDGLPVLINNTHRIGGYFVNADDVFFYSGGTDALNEFLKHYATIKDIAGHLLIIHPGERRALAPWDQDKSLWTRLRSKRCEWTLETGLVSAHEAVANVCVFRDKPAGCALLPLDKEKEENLYYAEVHVYTDSLVDIAALQIPPSITVQNTAAPAPSLPAPKKDTPGTAEQKK